MFGPSSINWCELDYIHSNYIAEYWNTITGIFLCISSVICFIKNVFNNTDKLYYSNLLLFFVGIGTIMFHSTLIYIWQLFDEIPMLLIVIEYYRILTNELHLIYYTNTYIYNYDTIYYIIPIIVLSYYVDMKLHVLLFQSVLAICIITIMYTCYNININLNKLYYNINPCLYVNKDIFKTNGIGYEKQLPSYKRKKSKQFTNIEMSTSHLSYINPSNVIDISNSFIEFKQYVKLKNKIRYHNYKGLFLLTFSFLIWNIDNHFCQHYIELHAIWHITTSIGMYSCNEIISSFININKQLVQKL